MNRQQGTLICLTYLVGLLSTRLFGLDRLHPTIGQWGMAIATWTILGAIATWAMPKWGRIYVKGRFWLAMG